jgi:hypothetical protein
MLYKTNPKNNDSLSRLGFGCMRFPKSAAETERLVRFAVENGVNYFDTAYIYPNSEEKLGRALEAGGLRDRVKIATKLPHYLVRKYEDLDRYLEKQLDRLRTDRIDYYLFHMLTDLKAFEWLSGLGIEKWIEEKKREGKIINIGFSFHGTKADFRKVVDAYPWEFCMIQYNILDVNNQAGLSGLQYAANEKGLPVIAMSPLRGGKLVRKLPKEVLKLYKEAAPDRTPAEWALRWVWNHPEVTALISGMTVIEDVRDNIKAVENAGERLTEEELLTYDLVRAALNKSILVPCTDCNYCMPCPKGVDISGCFSCLNSHALDGRLGSVIKYVMQTSLSTEMSNASLCNKCGACEPRCPQGIEIRKELRVVKKKLQPFYYRPARFLIRKFFAPKRKRTEDTDPPETFGKAEDTISPETFDTD